MPHITADDLNKIKAAYSNPRERGARASIMLCGGSSCSARGSLKLKETFEQELKQRNLDSEVSIYVTGCNGFCTQAPLLTLYPGGTFYQTLTPEDVIPIIEEHILKGEQYSKRLYSIGKDSISALSEIPFFKFQTLRVLKKRGLTDPDNIDDYIGGNGYFALLKALTGQEPAAIISELKASGLRGRGGGGFPTGLKWEICRKAGGGPDSRDKYIICNAGPISRNISDTDPHSIIEGMALAARATGASKGYIYIREPEHRFIITRMNLAVTKAKEYGLIGSKIFGTDFDFDVEVAIGAGTFICGEETALISSLEGTRGFPRPKPPYPAVKGLWGKPTIVDNAETFANVPLIVLNGADWFRSVGTEKSPGTKIFTLTGEVINNGLIEVPMGITLRSIVNDIGGGMKKKRKFKALHIGGPTGGFIPESLIDTPATYDDIVKTGAIVGSGNIIVMDDNTCMVNAAMFSMEFGKGESCGKCSPCRIGTTVMYEKFVDITEGRGKPGDIELLADIAAEVKRTTLCGLGQTSPLAVLTTIKYFRDEYEKHINEKWCPTGRCKALASFSIDESVCTGCTSCARKCPVNAITGEKKKPHSIDQSICIKCRTCFETCTFGSIRIQGQQTGTTKEA
ncbi:NADH-ubiquinone oxidoreductase-F iron-sulfur binding region domain-containing protein [Candidatus Magnetomonas plexicatena]|uniref:NADH-ubiquinone oxidoreductase-F iron-sulfur binding region domain-containing protein n=1 Tax=Candidatus Magnetomonas plexicatena TaxID=2552947 RepID=UPI0011017963|nr:NADH-quinone oxidoreductase subunit F [Nitrospirales bacterium LBB_01]